MATLPPQTKISIYVMRLSLIASLYHLSVTKPLVGTQTFTHSHAAEEIMCLLKNVRNRRESGIRA